MRAGERVKKYFLWFSNLWYKYLEKLTLCLVNFLWSSPTRLVCLWYIIYNWHTPGTFGISPGDSPVSRMKIFLIGVPPIILFAYPYSMICIPLELLAYPLEFLANPLGLKYPRWETLIKSKHCIIIVNWLQISFKFFNWN